MHKFELLTATLVARLHAAVVLGFRELHGLCGLGIKVMLRHAAQNSRVPVQLGSSRWVSAWGRCVSAQLCTSVFGGRAAKQPSSN